MNLYDYLILGFYFAMMLSIGAAFKRFNKDISDYFRGGGTMLWWMTGASAFMGGISVWSFTGAASKAYQAGTLIFVLYSAGSMGWLIMYFITCHRFRRARVITSVEAIQRRYGNTTEQFYVWVQVPRDILNASISLMTLGVFISSVFGTPFVATLVVVGAIVLFVASVGGVWAVAAGDFVQLLLMLLVVAVAAWLTLGLPEIGGLSGLVAKMPEAHFDWTLLLRPQVLVFWTLAIIVQTLLIYNDLAAGASRFMAVRDERHAKRAALMGFFVSLILPPLLFIPPFAATVLFPDLGTHFPDLAVPSEAAFVAVAIKCMPHGLLGLLVSGIFAVAMANIDTGLNKNAGIFVRNFYQKILRPAASPRELLLAGRGFTAFFGCTIIALAAWIGTVRNLNLFDLVNLIGAMAGLPIIVPLCLGLFIKNTPSWTGWSTALVSFAAAALAKWGVGTGLFTLCTGIPGAELTAQERTDVVFATTVLLVATIGSAWFLAVARLARSAISDEQRERAARFFRDLDTPIDAAREGIVYNDARQYRVIAPLCLIYGAVVSLGVAIPNPLEGRLCFLFVGGVMLAIGLVMRAAGRRATAAEAAPKPAPAPVA
jgi:solute:Na+ symporter, SSS family